MVGMSDRVFANELLSRLPDWEEYDQFWDVISGSEILAHRAVSELSRAVSSAQSRLANDNDIGSVARDVEWRRRKRNFINLAITRLKRLRTTVHVHSQHGDRINQAWRDLTKRLIIAIAEHRIDVEESGKRARSSDVILWDVLDELSFPNGGPLAALADVHLSKREREFDTTRKDMESHPAPRANRGVDSFRPVPVSNGGAA